MKDNSVFRKPLDPSNLKITMVLLLSLFLFRICTGFEAFDCSLKPQNIKDWDMTEIGDCQRPQDLYKEVEEASVQVVRNQDIQPQEVWECILFQTVTATRCGFDSIRYSSFELQTYSPVKIASEECRRLVKSRKLSMYKKEWDIESLEHFDFDADVLGKTFWIFIFRLLILCLLQDQERLQGVAQKLALSLSMVCCMKDTSKRQKSGVVLRKR